MSTRGRPRAVGHTGQLVPRRAPAARSRAERTSARNGKRYKGDLAKYFKDWRTYQLSDHNPLWVRLKVNESAAYLERLRDE